MKIIGITGNIASGKTTISKIIAAHFNLPLINVDEFTKHYIATYPLTIKGLLEESGISCPYDKIQETLKEIFFKNKTFKTKLEFILSINFWNYVHGHTVSKHNDVIVIEHPVLFEMYEQTRFDFIIGVDALETIRIDRMKQRGYTQETIYERIANQIPLYANKDGCDLILNNSPFLSKEKIIDELTNSTEFKALIS